MSPPGPRVVALGGGHGLAVTLAALTRVTPHVTAVVTVADDGGSSGRLRSELGMVPPGDLRMALAALAADDETGQLWSRLLQHRFSGDGPLSGHAVGNLLLAGLDQTERDLVRALDLVGQLVRAQGRVLPASCTPLEITAAVLGVDPDQPDVVTQVRGQVAVATTPGQVQSVSLSPHDPPACEEAVAAIAEADWVVLGPGSWFTSVLTHLLIPDLRAALEKTDARRLVALNLAVQPGETDGFTPETHLEVLVAHAPALALDVVLADRSAVVDTRGLLTAAETYGAQLVLADVALGDGSARHDPARLAEAYAGVFASGTSRQGAF